MRWNDVIALIALTPPEDRTNECGFVLDPIEQSRIVFANKKSVGYSEFYKSQQAGLKAELKFDVRTPDYEGEEIIEYNNKRYKVLRTYVNKNGEFIELTLSDLSERSEADGGI